MNMLDDDRKKYGIGKLVKTLSKRSSKKQKNTPRYDETDMAERGTISFADAKELIDNKSFTIEEVKRFLVASGESPKDVSKFAEEYMKAEAMKGLPLKDKKALLKRKKSKTEETDERLLDGTPPTEAEQEKMLDELMKRGEFYGGGMSKKRIGYAEGSLLNDDMPMMDSDEVMEDNYVDFVVAQTLSDEEQEFLNKQLEGNDKLSVIFDKVVGSASEFTGDGSVEGPGTGVSDDIPARLSDGEFVFTAKAVEEIGADKLEAMMKEAEVEADARQGMAFGGMLQEEEEIEGDMSMVSSDMRKVNPRLNPNLR